MSQLSDVEVLYELMGASHIPYREIKLEESKERSNSLWSLLNDIDLTYVEILPVKVSEKIEPLIVENFSIKHDSVESFSLPVRNLEPSATPDIFDVAVPTSIIVPVDMSAISSNFSGKMGLNNVNEKPFISILDASQSAISSVKVVEFNVETLPTDVNTSAFNEQPNSVSLPKFFTQLKSSEPDNNSEMSNLILRIKQSVEQGNSVGKHSFFERLQA